MRLVRFRKVASNTRLFIADDFIGSHEIDCLCRAAEHAAEGPAVIPTLKHDETGLSFEMPLHANPILMTVSMRMEAAFGFANRCGSSMRYRRYRQGEHHGLHYDNFEIEGNSLVATAILWLSNPESGGETRFPFALPSPLVLEARRGRLAVWLNYLANGSIDRSAMHEALPVSRGVKITLTNFVYAPIGAIPAFASGLCDETDMEGIRFEPVPSEV